MTVRLSKRLVVTTTLDNVACDISIDMEHKSGIRIDFLNCEKQKPIRLYALQNSGRIYNFIDVDTSVDFTGSTAITFNVWDSVAAGSTVRISKSLGSGVTANDTNKILVQLEDSDLGLSTGTLWWELWVTDSGDNKTVARGDFVIQDTRKYD